MEIVVSLRGFGLAILTAMLVFRMRFHLAAAVVTAVVLGLVL